MLEDQDAHFGFMDVILLLSDRQHVSANDVEIYQRLGGLRWR